VSRKHPSEAEQGVGRKRYAVLLSLIVFAMLAAMPQILAALHLHEPGKPLSVGSVPTTSRGVPLLPAPAALPPVTVSSVALPVAPGRQPASPPKVSATTQAAAVTAEDTRIRILLHDSATIYQPQVVPVQGSSPTLVLTGSYTLMGYIQVLTGSITYTYADLVRYGALLPLPNHAALLVDSVFVAADAHLDLGSPNLRTLYLSRSSGGFASIVAWGGSLAFKGTAQHPLTIMGWNRAAKSPAADAGGGRPYIREVGGRMDVANVRASALGFWSGRTGGVAWTGATGLPSTGGATSSTFMHDTYGAFVSRGLRVRFQGDLFESNELDGLHIHRNTVGTSVTASSAIRNGTNGFYVGRATDGTVLKEDLSQHNRGDGVLVDGRPLVTGASASGSSVAPDSGTYIENSTSVGNFRTGIVLEGGTGTVLQSNEVCAQNTGIAIRTGASGTVVTGNDIRCGPRVALAVGPNAPDTMVSGNSLVAARIGMLVRNSGHLEADNNRITEAKVFGITARGPTSHVIGQYNLITGSGFRSVDASTGAGLPVLPHTRDAGWVHHLKINLWAYLRFHPLALLWLSILFLVIFGEFWSRIRRLPEHAYAASTHWRPTPAGRSPRASAEDAAAPVLAKAVAAGDGHQRPAKAVAAGDGHQRPAKAVAAGDGHQRPAKAVAAGDGHQRPAKAVAAGNGHQRPAEVIASGNGHQHPERAAVAGGRPGEDHRIWIPDGAARAAAGRAVGGGRWLDGSGQGDGHRPDQAAQNGHDPTAGHRGQDGRRPGEGLSTPAGQGPLDGRPPANGHGPAGGAPDEWFSPAGGLQPGDGANPGDRAGRYVGTPASPAASTPDGRDVPPEPADGTCPLPRVEDWL
jgi:hypothetical protein